jgi:hypothetical protein
MREVWERSEKMIKSDIFSEVGIKLIVIECLDDDGNVRSESDIFTDIIYSLNRAFTSDGGNKTTCVREAGLKIGIDKAFINSMHNIIDNEEPLKRYYLLPIDDVSIYKEDMNAMCERHLSIYLNGYEYLVIDRPDNYISTDSSIELNIF